MPPIATGQISIIDYNDIPYLTAFLSTTSPKSQIYDPASGSYTPNWTSAPVTLSASLLVSSRGQVDQIANAKSVKWYDSDNRSTALATGGAYTVTGTTLKIAQNLMTGSIYSKTYICEIIWADEFSGTDLPIKTDFTFSRTNNGATGATGAYAISAVLTNESDVIPTDVNGNNGNFTGANTTMSIYEGATDVSASWTVTAGTPNGLVGSLSGKTYTVTAMTAGVDTGYVDLIASRAGYSNISKRFALAKSKTGVAGTTPTLYRLISSAAAIQKTISGAYTPTSITLTAKSQTGTAAMGNYSGRFTVEESTDGTTWPTTPKYTATADAASYVYTPAAGIKAARVKLYLAGGVTTLLDEQVIPIVSDGATGATGIDAVLVTAYAPEGNLFKNDLLSSLTATAELYKGATLTTAGVTYEWFVRKSGAADSGAGAGWDKVTTANQATYGITGAINGATVTITKNGVVNIAVLKIKATFSSKAYYDTVIFYDQTDPIMLQVTSSNGELFRNGEINSRLTCIVYQNGVEVDPVKAASATEGYKYSYKWTKFKKDGDQDTTFGTNGVKTGKWIDITNADVYMKSVFNVEII